MKRILYAVIAALTLPLVSCKDFLETSSKSLFTTDVVFDNPGNATKAVMGIYALMTTDELYSSRSSLMLPYNSDIEVAGADASSYNQVGNRGISNYWATPSFTGHLERIWTVYYRAIERANLAITEIPKSPAFLNGTPEEKNLMSGLLAEALTLRAIFYYELVRNWGDVPFKTEPTDPKGSNTYLGVTDRDTIYAHLLEDLSLVDKVYKLPLVNTNNYTAERVTRTFAKGLRARIALAAGGYSIRNKQGFPTERPENWKDFYEIANTECREIMELGINRLNPDYEGIFKTMCQWRLDNVYNESMFEVAMGYERSGEMGYSIGVRFDVNTRYGYSNNAGVLSVSPYYYYMFNPKDKRKDVTVCYYRFRATNREEMETNNAYNWYIGKYDQRWMPDLFLQGNLAAGRGKVGYGINWCMMRYADVLLMFAETENELRNGPTAEAIEAFRQVRSRAFADADQAVYVTQYIASVSGSKSDFFDAIVNERAVEFGGEAIRKYDLIRWNMLVSKIQQQRDTYKAMINAQYPVTVGENTYTFLPSTLFYSYRTDDVTRIDRGGVNFYTDKGNAAITGYTMVAFLSGWSTTNKENALNVIDRFSSGLNQSGVTNRHLFPIQASILANSAGMLQNSYNF